MLKPQSPCLDCADRHELCHASCPLYLKYSDDMDVYRLEVKNARMSDYIGKITDSTRYHRKKRKRG